MAMRDFWNGKECSISQAPVLVEVKGLCGREAPLTPLGSYKQDILIEL